MLKIIHPRYAVKVLDNFIPQHIVTEFVDEVNFFEKRKQVEDNYFSQLKQSPLMYKILSLGQEFLRNFNVRVMAVEYFIWRRENLTIMPHVDMTTNTLNKTVDTNQLLTPICVRLNLPIYSSGCVMDWFEVRENSIWMDHVRGGLDGNHDVMKIDRDSVPDFSTPVDDIMFLNTSIPHRINMEHVHQDRLTLSFKIKNKFNFEEFVKQISEQHLNV